jgi:hypothetical protein
MLCKEHKYYSMYFCFYVPLEMSETELNKYLQFWFTQIISGGGGTGGSVAIKALCYKLEGRGFETR